MGNRDSRDLRVFRMRNGKLLSRGGFDHFADSGDVFPLVGSQAKPEGLRVRDHVDHAPVSDVHRRRSQIRHFDHPVEIDREGRNVLEGDADHFPIFDLGFHPDQAGRSVQLQPDDSFLRGHHPGLDEHRHDADRVRSGHRRILGLLHDDETRVRLRIRGRKNQVAVGRRISARLAQHPLSQVVCVVFEIDLFLEHRLAGNVQNTAHDDAPRLAGGMRVDGRDHVGELHAGLPARRDIQA